MFWNKLFKDKDTKQETLEMENETMDEVETTLEAAVQECTDIVKSVELYIAGLTAKVVNLAKQLTDTLANPVADPAVQQATVNTLVAQLGQTNTTLAVVNTIAANTLAAPAPVTPAA